NASGRSRNPASFWPPGERQSDHEIRKAGGNDMIGMVRRIITGLLLAITLGGPAVVYADGLRPEWTVDRARADPTRVGGYRYNDNDLRIASHVRLRVEQLTATGTVGKIYQSFVVGDVPSRNRMSFDVAVTEPDGAANYRVLVESVDWVMECR